MSVELLDIQPRELKFTFELKKQSSCLVLLTNNSDQYVAFKVKTTSPKRYCVRPNVGVVSPKSTYDFTVTMQAQRVAPPDMQCKDKFLVQSTVVPYGTTVDEKSSDIFRKDSGKDIEESKLRVILVSPPHSPVLQPINGVLNQDLVYEAPRTKDQISAAPVLKDQISSAPVIKDSVPPVPVLKDPTPGLKDPVPPAPVLKDPTPVSKDPVPSAPVLKDPIPLARVLKDPIPLARVLKDSIPPDPVLKDQPSPLAKDQKATDLIRDESSPPSREIVDREGLKSKLNDSESKLVEAEKTISLLREEWNTAIQACEKLQEEMMLLKKGASATTKVQVGFPLFFVCFISIISVIMGYLIHP
ncbi:Vesicle-associated protein 2-2 [Acorus calamus]|uniref:Vesicle-associated protein 2-2 n=1 Tax=Acorus calamus TaxID=4465 RepID=A0AAV9ETQ3_ACOCL|nr:Vesicle-associated protein 2-2 [Acorus calamus]